MAFFRRTWQGRRLRDMDLREALADPGRRQPYVTFMFDLLAPGYDLFTRVFSFGMDRGWKRTLLAEVRCGAPGARLVLDLACGTGDLADGARAGSPQAMVLGVDASREMVTAAAGRTAATGARPRFVVGDLTCIGVRSAAADAVTVGYGLRNVPSFRDGLREIHRVLKPGALLVTLDFYQPARRWWRGLFLTYLRWAGAVAGWLWHGEPVAYAYLAPSLERFVTADQFSACLETTGFEVARCHRRLLGGIAIHVARKRPGT